MALGLSKNSVIDRGQYFFKNGIPKEIDVSSTDWESFENYLRVNEHFVYKCQTIKEKISGDIRLFMTPKQVRGSQQKLSLRLLITSKGII